MCGVFDQVAREEIRRRGDLFLTACTDFTKAANNLSEQLKKLTSQIEMGKFDAKLFAGSSAFTSQGISDLTKKTDEVAKAGNNFGKALKEF